MNCLSKAELIVFLGGGSQEKNHHFSVDVYLVKFEEDGIRRVFGRDKVKIKDKAVEAGATCQAYWEDSHIKGWFPAVIALDGSYRLKLPNDMKLELDFS